MDNRLEFNPKILVLATEFGRYHNVELILTYRGKEIPDDILYHAFTACFHEGVTWSKLVNPFFRLERFRIPKQKSRNTACVEELIRRKILIMTNRLKRWIGVLPNDVWTIISKYVIYYTTQQPYLPYFAEVALGNKDCNIKEVLSVGGVWNDETERYLANRQKEREYNSLKRQMDQLLEQNPHFNKKLKR